MHVCYLVRRVLQSEGWRNRLFFNFWLWLTALSPWPNSAHFICSTEYLSFKLTVIYWKWENSSKLFLKEALKRLEKVSGHEFTFSLGHGSTSFPSQSLPDSPPGAKCPTHWLDVWVLKCFWWSYIICYLFVFSERNDCFHNSMTWQFTGFAFVCIDVCTLTCSHTRTAAHVWIWVWKTEENLCCCSYGAIGLVFWHKVSHWPEVPQVG